MMPLPSKRSRLGPEAFGKVPVATSIEFKGVVSTAATPEWYSPAASNVCQPVADLALVDRLYRNHSVFQHQVK